MRRKKGYDGIGFPAFWVVLKDEKKGPGRLKGGGGLYIGVEWLPGRVVSL